MGERGHFPSFKVTGPRPLPTPRRGFRRDVQLGHLWWGQGALTFVENVLVAARWGVYLAPLCLHGPAALFCGFCAWRVDGKCEFRQDVITLSLPEDSGECEIALCAPTFTSEILCKPETGGRAQWPRCSIQAAIWVNVLVGPRGPRHFTLLCLSFLTCQMGLLQI